MESHCGSDKGKKMKKANNKQQKKNKACAHDQQRVCVCVCTLAFSDPLRVTLSPKNLKTGISSTLFFTCTVEGSPEYTITWFRNTELILPDQHISIQGQHNDTLQITAAQKFHSGAYQCFASRKGHTAQDFSIILLEGTSREDCVGLAFR